MQSIKTFLVDDEIGALNALEYILSDAAPELDIIGKARTVSDAFDKICLTKPELVFLDIQLVNQTGFDLLRKPFNFHFEVIFVTAFDQYALEAFKNNALSYLLKPISYSDVEHVLKRTLQLFNSQRPQSFQKINEIFRNRLAIPQSSGIEYLDLDEVLYVEADGSYCTIYLTKNRKKTVSRPLRFIEESIYNDLFIRVHRSYLINATYIRKWEKIQGGYLVLENQAHIPISKNGRAILSSIL